MAFQLDIGFTSLAGTKPINEDFCAAMLPEAGQVDMGCIVALRELEHRDRPVALYSDSSYVVNGISKGWAKGWRKRGWVKADRQPAVNPDLWGQLLDLIEGLNITFNWVKGHNGNPFNERCDELAVASSRQDDLPVDAGYKG